MEMKSPAIVIAGCGPGSPDYLTPAVRSAVDGAEVLAGAPRLLALFPGYRGEKIVVGADIENVLDRLASFVGRQRIVVLVTGDPGLCSLARPVLRRFGRQACEVIPGISSVQVAFARLGRDWREAAIIDAHGGDPDVDLPSLARKEKIAVLAGRREAVAWSAGLVKTLGAGRRSYLCENLTLVDERIREVSAAELENCAPSSRAIVIVLREEDGE